MDNNREKTIEERYFEIAPEGSSFSEAVECVKNAQGVQDYDDIVMFLLNLILDEYCQDRWTYPQKLSADECEMRELYWDAVNLLSEDYPYYMAVRDLFVGDFASMHNNLESHLAKKYGAGSEESLGEEEFAYDYFDIFKNAYKGFWVVFASVLEKCEVNSNVKALCLVLDDFFWAGSQDKSLEVLLPFMGQHNEMVLPKEIAGSLYFEKKMWSNALAYCEQVEDKNIVINDSVLFFMMAWAYGKQKDLVNEELYYKKTIEIDPDDGLAKNNLGYCLYRQRKYTEALVLFTECLESGEFERFVPNNYVRTLIAMNRLLEARQFVDSGKCFVAKDLKDRLAKAEEKQAVSHQPSILINDEPLDEEDEEETAEEAELGLFVDDNAQFTTERLLEDELTARIESGQSVFGLNLKLWRRKGEYGRQYILPTGKRLDLLCEDDSGDIYIIELKKDSGYDDPYDQTVEYIEWFENEPRFKGKNIHGLICLNSPTADLLEKARGDKRVRVFEYRVVYEEK